ncbi:MAG TPA: FAD-binding oxidoreductase, partial [Cytophagales bacterium]|nr:FAD-binding oxidoreductase [Cytophagales bacterium]
MILDDFRSVVGADHVIVDTTRLEDYGHDKTEDYFFMPDAVVRPGTTEEVSKILRICNQHRIPVTPRGAGTGLSGGALPVKNGVVLSMERFN